MRIQVPYLMYTGCRQVSTFSVKVVYRCRQDVNSMASQIISFRLTEPEVQALEAEKLVGESLNQVAQRLMRQMLNGTSKSVDSSVDARLNYLEAKMAMILGEVPGELSA